MTLYDGFRGACRVGVLPAHGLVHVLANSHTHDCTCVPFRAMIALEPGAALEKVTDQDLRVERFPGQLPAGEAAPATATDWPTVRADPARTGVTRQDLSQAPAGRWKTRLTGTLTAPVAVGGRVYVGSTDECVYALDAANGQTVWRFYSGGPVRAAPTQWNGRSFAGFDDGWVYCLRASSGEPLWRVRCAPPARRQLGYGAIVSAWPVRQGLAVEGGHSTSPWA